jgi:hypothetical protein
MSWQRLYNFQAGTKINSGQVNGELNQLIASVNQIQTDDNSKDTDLRSKAQMYKFLQDDGTRKLLPASTNLTTVAVGAYYMVGTSITTPTMPIPTDAAYYTVDVTKSADMTQFLLRRNFDNRTWFGSVHTAVFKGWNEVVTNNMTQAELWTGAGYPPAASTIPPTKKLSECRNGWILVWSDFVPGTGANDYDFYTSVVPKYYGTAQNGKSHLFVIPTSLGTTAFSTTGKRLYIYDDKIVGHDDNSFNGTNNVGSAGVCLRAVIEW